MGLLPRSNFVNSLGFGLFSSHFFCLLPRSNFVNSLGFGLFSSHFFCLLPRSNFVNSPGFGLFSSHFCLSPRSNFVNSPGMLWKFWLFRFPSIKTGQLFCAIILVFSFTAQELSNYGQQLTIPYLLMGISIYGIHTGNFLPRTHHNF